MSDCEVCGGAGFEIVVRDDRDFAKTCVCRATGAKGPDVFERLGRPQSTAALLEEVLDLAAKGETTLEQDRYDELEKRLTKLDAKNQALRLAKIRSKNYSKMALKLLEGYQASEVPMTGAQPPEIFQLPSFCWLRSIFATHFSSPRRTRA